MPTITQFEYLIAVDETKSFSRAAEKCHVSQPSLSSQIQKVEEEMDFIVFDRSKQPILTTKKGKELIEQSKKVLREYKRVFDIKKESHLLSGEFHLGVIPSVSSHLLPLFIASFSKKYPLVKLSITEYKTEVILDLLYDDYIDAGLLATPLYNDKIIERTLFYEKFLLFMSKNHDLLKKDLILHEELNRFPIWILEEGHCFRDQVMKVCSMEGRKDVLHNIKFQSGSLDTLINLVRRGEGYTLIPELATINLSETEKQENVKKFEEPVPSREISLVHSRSFLKQDIVVALEKEIIKNLPLHIKSIKRDKVSVINIK